MAADDGENAKTRAVLSFRVAIAPSSIHLYSSAARSGAPEVLRVVRLPEPLRKQPLGLQAALSLQRGEEVRVLSVSEAPAGRRVAPRPRGRGVRGQRPWPSTWGGPRGPRIQNKDTRGLPSVSAIFLFVSPADPPCPAPELAIDSSSTSASAGGETAGASSSSNPFPTPAACSGWLSGSTRPASSTARSGPQRRPSRQRGGGGRRRRCRRGWPRPRRAGRQPSPRSAIADLARPAPPGAPSVRWGGAGRRSQRGTRAVAA